MIRILAELDVRQRRGTCHQRWVEEVSDAAGPVVGVFCLLLNLRVQYLTLSLGQVQRSERVCCPSYREVE